MRKAFHKFISFKLAKVYLAALFVVFGIPLAFILSQADNGRDFKHNIFISRDCKCAMPYTLSVLRKMLKHVFNSEINLGWYRINNVWYSVFA